VRVKIALELPHGILETTNCGLDLCNILLVDISLSPDTRGLIGVDSCLSR